MCFDCNYAAVNAVENHEATVRNAFIAGFSSNYIRQRLLENNILGLQVAYDDKATAK